MEVTKWLKPSDSVSRIGDSASVQATFMGIGLDPTNVACWESLWTSANYRIFA